MTNSIDILTARFGGIAQAAGSLVSTPIKTANYTAVQGQRVLCNSTSSAFQVTLQMSGALAGKTWGVRDVGGAAATNAITVVLSNGGTIITEAGSGTSVVLDLAGDDYEFTYNGSQVVAYYRSNAVLDSGGGLAAGLASPGAATPVDGDLLPLLRAGALAGTSEVGLLQDKWHGGLTGEVANSLQTRLARIPRSVDFGATANGVADDRAGIERLVGALNGKRAYLELLNSCDAKMVPPTIATGGGVHLVGSGRSRINKRHASKGIECIAPTFGTGTIVAGGTTAQPILTGIGTFTENALVGKVLMVPVGSAKYRRITANTATSGGNTTVTVDYLIGSSYPSAGQAITLYTPIPYVILEDLEIYDVTPDGGSGIDIQMADLVILRNVWSNNNSGNGIQLQHCLNVKIEGGGAVDNNVNLFCINCEQGSVFGFYSSGSLGNAEDAHHGMGFKNCRLWTVFGCTSWDDYYGVGVKCSGNDASYDVTVTGCSVSGARAAGYHIYVLNNEDTTFLAKNWVVTGNACRGGVTGALLDTSSTAAQNNGLTFSNNRIEETTSTGLSVKWKGALCEGNAVEKCGLRGIDVVSTFVTIRGGKTVDNNNINTLPGAAADGEIRLQSSTDCLVENIAIEKNTGSGSLSTSGVRELTSPARNRINNVSMVGSSPIGTPYLVSGTDSFVKWPPGRIVTRTGAISASILEEVILMNITADATLTLPQTSTAIHKEFDIAHVGTAGNLTIDGNGAETVDGVANKVLTTGQRTHVRCTATGVWFSL
jgi:hypothetical protein